MKARKSPSTLRRESDRLANFIFKKQQQRLDQVEENLIPLLAERQEDYQRLSFLVEDKYSLLAEREEEELYDEILEVEEALEETNQQIEEIQGLLAEIASLRVLI